MMPEGSPARAVVVAALLLALGAGATWALLQWRAASADRPGPSTQATTPTPSPAPSPDAGHTPERRPTPSPSMAEPESASSPSPAPSPESTPDHPDDDGPATGPYAAFSPSYQLTHPDTDPDIRRWYDWFGYFVGDEVGVPSGEWTNKEELWDGLAPYLREEALSLGPEASQPQFPGMEIVPALANVRWSEDDTDGRGEFVEFSIVFESEDGVVERYHSLLIATNRSGKGSIRTRMEPFDLRASNFDNFSEMRDSSAQRQWRWIMEQPLLEEQG